MSDNKLEHIALTQLRGPAFVEFFGGKPEKIFPFHGFDDADDAYLIDVLIFCSIRTIPRPRDRAVTNGMSDYVMIDAETGARSRCELIQYFHDCDADHAQRLTISPGCL